MGPFDSQNTFLSAEILRDYFVFPHVGRMDDIWAAYYVQAKGCKVVYNRPSVYQARNEHDPIGDMRQEYLGYENNLKLVEDLVRDPESILQYLPDRSARAFKLYRRHFGPRLRQSKKQRLQFSCRMGFSPSRFVGRRAKAHPTTCQRRFFALPNRSRGLSQFSRLIEVQFALHLSAFACNDG